MPRATAKAGRSYSPQIIQLQTLLRLTKDDERIPLRQRQQLSAEIDHITTTLSNAQAKVEGEIT